MRARIDELERELVRANARIEDLAPQAEEAQQLRSRVEELERELSGFKQTSKEKKQRAAKAKSEAVAASSDDENPFPRWLTQLSLPVKIVSAVVGACSVGGFLYWQFAPATWTNAHAAPSIGLVDLDRTPTPPIIHGSTLGSEGTPMGCIGFIPSAPHLVLQTAHPVLGLIDVESTEDTVLVVLDAAGDVHCDDDGGGGNNPYLIAPLSAGETRVWVGTYSEDQRADFSITVATREGSALPDERGIAPDAPPQLGVLGEMFEGPRRYEGTILPVTHAADVEQRCAGYIEIEPTLALNLTEPTYVDLNAGGSSDLTLFMESEGTIRCDDDGGPNNQPRITELLPVGMHRLWVGSYSRVIAPVPYWLEARVATPARGHDAPLLPLALDAQSTITPRAEAMVRECAMFIPAAPDAIVELRESLDVRITGPVMVSDAQGRRCLMPGVSTWTAGRHDVYLSVDAEEVRRTATPILIHASAPSVLPYAP